MRGKQLVKHQINNHACNRYIEPDRIGPPGDLLVGIIPFPKTPDERDEGKRDDRCGQNAVRYKNRKIQDPHPSGPLKWL